MVPLPAEERVLKSHSTSHSSPNRPSVSLDLSVLTHGPHLAQCPGLLVTSSAHRPLVKAFHHPISRSSFPSPPK